MEVPNPNITGETNVGISETIIADASEQRFVDAFLKDKEVVVPLIPADSHIESLDKTKEYAHSIIEKFGIHKCETPEGTEYAVGNARYTEEHGWHYFVHVSRVGKS